MKIHTGNYNELIDRLKSESKLNELLEHRVSLSEQKELCVEDSIVYESGESTTRDRLGDLKKKSLNESSKRKTRRRTMSIALSNNIFKMTEKAGFDYAYLTAISNAMSETLSESTILKDMLTFDTSEHIFKHKGVKTTYETLKPYFFTTTKNAYTFVEDLLTIMKEEVNNNFANINNFKAFLLSGEYFRTSYEPKNNYIGMFSLFNSEYARKFDLDNALQNTKPNIIEYSLLLINNVAKEKGFSFGQIDNSIIFTIRDSIVVLRHTIHDISIAKEFLRLNDVKESLVNKLSTQDCLAINSYLLLKYLKVPTESKTPMLDVPSNIVEFLNSHEEVENSLFKVSLQIEDIIPELKETTDSVETIILEQRFNEIYDFNRRDTHKFILDLLTKEIGTLTELESYSETAKLIDKNMEGHLIYSGGSGAPLKDVEEPIGNLEIILAISQTETYKRKLTKAMTSNVEKNLNTYTPRGSIRYGELITRFMESLDEDIFNSKESSLMGKASQYTVSDLPVDFDLQKFKIDSNYHNDILEIFLNKIQEGIIESNKTEKRNGIMMLRDMVGYSVGIESLSEEKDEETHLPPLEQLLPKAYQVMIERVNNFILKKNLIFLNENPDNLQKVLTMNSANSHGESLHTFKGIKNIYKVSSLFNFLR